MTMVMHEEQCPMGGSNNSNSDGNSGAGGSRSSKKKKQRKTPQRGMGVAQLEELRIREQQRSATPNIFFPHAVDPNPLSRSLLPIHSNMVDYFGPSPTLPHVLGSSAMGFGGSTDRGSLSMLCNNAMEPCPQDSEAVARKCGLLASLQSGPLNPNWRPPDPLQRMQHQQLLSMANKRLQPSSSGVNLRMEPPSNQSYTSNHPMPSSWLDEEKMVGMKRPWPFHPHTLFSYPCKAPICNTPFLKPDESLNGSGSIKYEPKYPMFRDSFASSSSNQVDWRDYYNHNKSRTETGAATDEGFLTLGPSVVPSISKSKHPFDLPQSQGCTDDALSQPAVSSEPPFHSFFPMGPAGHETTLNNLRGETLDSVDLNLKL